MGWRIILFVLPTLFALTCGGLVGGFSEINIEDNAAARKALNVAVEKHNNQRNCMCLSKVEAVKKAEVQVVDGFMYRITVVMARTTCRKNRTPEKCPFFEDPGMAQPYECTFRVLSRPWLENATEVHEECS